MNLLEVNNYSLELKQDDEWNSILSSVSFSLQKGETLGIVGESGSGKSVTALSIMRLLSAKSANVTGGNILFRGNRIAMVFQEPMTSLNPVIKCGLQVTEAILLHTGLTKKEAHKKTVELFKDVQLSEPEKVFHKYPHELSGGQKQRVMIAMAMSCNPDILIADEPTTALDVTVQKSILELLQQIQQKYGMCLLFISHDLNVVAQIAHRVLVMYQGKIVEQGEINSVFKNPQHLYTKRLLECRRKMDENCKSEYFKTSFSNINLSRKIIQIVNLSKFFEIRKKHLFEKQQYFQALNSINLDIYEGETLGLVGESGCGKTTLGRTLLRLVEPESGSVYYNGVDLKTISNASVRKIRHEIQIILQDPYSSLNQRLTIGQMLIEPMKVHRILANDKERKQRAIELLERVGLEESHLHRYPHEFSGGQRQRIAIARTLTVKPTFIVCDESVSALDLSVQTQVLNLLNDLKKEFNLTYLFISHDLSVVRYMSDRIAVMQHGKIVELNNAEDIYINPQTEYTKKLIEAVPKVI
ncbi:MAG: ABC transporter ATP-binding protein [Bacteroidales bacterium]|jgi:peptide/nickel transport system ATP-binding protein|nr:ABC transporter ATP-binding protein [Bacteroidales bacterium]